MYLELKQKEPTSRYAFYLQYIYKHTNVEYRPLSCKHVLNLVDRKGRSSLSVLSNPLVVSRYIGMLSGFEILAVSLFVIFLAWTFYSRISSDFKKMIPIKSFALHV